MLRLLLFLFILTLPVASQAGFVLKEGELVAIPEKEVSGSAQELHSEILAHYEQEDWKELSKLAEDMIKFFPSSPFVQDARYYLGVAYFKLEDFELANDSFSEYLTRQASPRYFEEAIQYKFEIAEMFRKGARKHLGGYKSMPKWSPARSEALKIYDEVISALPHHDLAAHALFGKAEVHAKNNDFRASIEAYQTLIRRFPKHPLAVESYIGIGEVYFRQSQAEYTDPDFLDLAELNLKKFRNSFPREDRLVVAQQNFVAMQDHYASSLYETARFYERTKKWGAAKIYYVKIIKTYPISELAEKSKKRLEVVEAKLAKLVK